MRKSDELTKDLDKKIRSTLFGSFAEKHNLPTSITQIPLFPFKTFDELGDAIKAGEVELVPNALASSEIIETTINLLANDNQRWIRFFWGASSYFLCIIIVVSAFFINIWLLLSIFIMAMSFLTTSRFFPGHKFIAFIALILTIYAVITKNVLGFLSMQYLLNYIFMNRARTLTNQVILEACLKFESAFIICARWRSVLLLDVKTKRRIDCFKIEE